MNAVLIKSGATSANKSTFFFNKESGQHFFHSHLNERPFFTKTYNQGGSIQPKLTIGQPNDIYEKEADAMADKVVRRLALNDQSGQHSISVEREEGDGTLSKSSIIQRQEQPDAEVTKATTEKPDEATPPVTWGGSPRMKRCYKNPQFPDFDCFTTALKLDIDENLWNNAHHFYRAATLHPGDNDLMWNTFLRYGLGVNLLKTSFGFAGANATLGTALSYGTGIGLKSYEFFKNGKLELDLPIPLGKGVNLDLKLDLNADPNNLSNIKQVNTGIGVSGHF